MRVDFIFLVVSTVLIFTAAYMLVVDAQTCHLRGCTGGGCAPSNYCPSGSEAGAITQDNYYDASTAACNQIICDDVTGPDLECLQSGALPLCEVPETCCPPSCPIIGCEEFVDTICAYSYATHQPPTWGWWKRGYMIIENDSLIWGNSYQCNDDRDNNCDMKCDTTGCCTNTSFTTQAECEGTSISFCNLVDAAYTEKSYCESYGGTFHNINHQGYCADTWASTEAWCDLNAPLTEWITINYVWMAPDPSCDAAVPSTTLSVSGSTGGGWYRGTLDLTLTCNDGPQSSGCNTSMMCFEPTATPTCDPRTPYVTPYPWNPTSNGDWSIGYRSNDSAGNYEATHYDIIQYDGNAPTIGDNAPAGPQSTTVTVTLTCSDADSGCDIMRYCFGAGCNPAASSSSATSWPFNIVYSGSQTGNVTRYQAWDIAGNPTFVNEYTIDIEDTTPTTTFIAPPDGSWQNTNFNVMIDDTTADSCEYAVASMGTITVNPTGRTCGPPPQSTLITVGNMLNCRHEGVNMCFIASQATNTTSGLFSPSTNIQVSIDWTDPVYNSGAYSITGCRYPSPSANPCWITNGDVVTQRISHTDTVSSPKTQYLELYDHDRWIRSHYDVDTDTLTPDLTDSSYLTINSASCVGSCNGQTAEVQWEVEAESPGSNIFEVWTLMEDEAGNSVGYTDTGQRIGLDNSRPGASITINGNPTVTYVPDVTLQLTYTDSLSGVDDCSYMDSDDATWRAWEACTPTKLWSFGSLGPKTISYRVRDNVGKISFTRTYDINYLAVSDDLSIDIEIDGGASYTNNVNVNLDFSKLPDELHDYKYWNLSETEPSGWTTTPGPGTPSWTVPVSLPPGDGLKTVNAKIRNTSLATATDSDSITLDTTDPTCTMTALPVWMNESFTIYWSCTDNYDIALNETQINDGSWQPVASYCSSSPQGNNHVTCAIAGFTDGQTYQFRTRSTDAAGNQGDWSNAVSTTVDQTKPTSYFDTGMPHWIGSNWTGWTGDVGAGQYSFKLFWDNQSDASGVNCFDFQWHNGSAYDTLLNCIDVKEYEFGPTLPGSAANVAEGVEYWFRVRAWDDAGNFGDWTDHNVTVDVSDPILTINISFGSVNVTSSAVDSPAGLLNHTFDWELPGSEGITQCPITGGGIPSICNQIFVSNKLRMVVSAIDLAGNMVQQEIAFGKMVNFIVHELNIIIGSKQNLKVEVRNPENQLNNITLQLYGDYPASLYHFLDIGWVNYTITPDGKNITIYDFAPYDETIFFVEVASGEHDDIGQYIRINATSATTGDVETDSVIVRVIYPAIFPGLNDIAAVLLIFVAVGTYYSYSRSLNKSQKKIRNRIE